MMRPSWKAGLLLAALGGCSPGPGTVVVTVTAEPAIAGVARLTGTAAARGEQRAVTIVPAGAPIALPPEGRYGIEAPADAEVVLRLSAWTAAGTVLAVGEARAVVLSGARTTVTLVLRPQAAPVDGGVGAGDLLRPADLAAAGDLERRDLALAVDAAPLDMSAAADLARAADLSASSDGKSADLALPRADLSPGDAAGRRDLGATPCAADGDCPGGLCNWALNACSPPLANGGSCRRDQECLSGLCNWSLNACSAPLGIGGACKRDSECAGGLCSWSRSLCATPGAAGAACGRDMECAGGICNWKTNKCAPKQPIGGPCRRDLECGSGRCNALTDTCT